MKNIKLYVLMFLIGGMTLTSCESYFGDVNVDPDNPIEVTPEVLLSQIETRLAYTIWGDASRYVGIYNQHVDGVGRQFAVIQNYGITPADLDAMWGSNLYSGVLMDNRQMRAIAEEAGYNHFVGVSKAIEAYTVMMMTDLFGDIPYTEALLGPDVVIQPKFDTQESIYAALFTLITEAKANLAADDGGLSLRSDIIYGGSVAKWTKFLNVLEAKGKLHLAERNSTAYSEALAALASGGFADGSDDARFQFGSAATEAAPWYQYTQQRDDIDVSGRFVSLLQGLSDPREATYGAAIEEGVPHPIFVADRAVPLMTYAEAKFIEAECEFNENGAAAAHPAYLAAIAASFEETGDTTGMAVYMAQSTIDPGAASLTLEHIMTQKHIAMFGHYEAFSDWRRTGFPDLTAAPNTGTVVPRRLPYAQSEILSNANTPSTATVDIYTRVWWDAN